MSESDGEGHSSEPELATKAWMLQGLGNVPGILLAANGVVAFVSDDGVLFEAPRREISVSWPKMQMSGGAHFVVDGVKHRIAFVRPNGAADATLSGTVRLGGALGGVAGIIEIGRLVGSITDGRAAGKRWRSFLDGN